MTRHPRIALAALLAALAMLVPSSMSATRASADDTSGPGARSISVRAKVASTRHGRLKVVATITNTGATPVRSAGVGGSVDVFWSRRAGSHTAYSLSSSAGDSQLWDPVSRSGLGVGAGGTNLAPGQSYRVTWMLRPVRWVDGRFLPRHVGVFFGRLDFVGGALDDRGGLSTSPTYVSAIVRS